MNNEEFESTYPAVMQDAVRRIIAAENSLSDVASDPQHPFSWVGCEIAVVQVRKLCELFLLAATIAHLEAGETELSPHKWRPKDAFAQLEKTSEHPTQLPVSIEIDHNGQGSHQIFPKSQPLTYHALSVIYGVCGDLLHVPTAHQVAKGKLPPFDVSRLVRWIAGFREIAQAHALMLPERQRVYLCQWSGAVDEAPQLHLLHAMGESTLNIQDYPAFSLLP